MNNPLGVMQMKRQIREEEWHWLSCQTQMCPRFHSVSIYRSCRRAECGGVVSGGEFLKDGGRWMEEAGMAESSSRLESLERDQTAQYWQQEHPHFKAA